MISPEKLSNILGDLEKGITGFCVMPAGDFPGKKKDPAGSETGNRQPSEVQVRAESI